MTINIPEILAALKSYQGLGEFKQLIINADGTMSAVYQHGLLQFDATGKLVN